MNYIKKVMITIGLFLLTLCYMLMIDPDFNAISNMPYGVAILLLIEVTLIAALGIAIIEVVPDLFIDDVYKNEDELVEMARTSPEGAGLSLIAKSIRVLSAAIIVGIAIVGYMFTT